MTELAIITLSLERFDEALRILDSEVKMFNSDPRLSEARLVGIFAEMGTAEFLAYRHRDRMVVPVGLMARTKMISAGAFNEGDIMTVTRRKDSRRLTHLYEVKGASVGGEKCIIRRDHAEQYHDQGISAVFFCEVVVSKKDRIAKVKVLEQVAPSAILNHWSGVINREGFESYQHPGHIRN